MNGTVRPKVRPATPPDAASIARIQVTSWRAAYSGIVPEGFLSRMSAGEYEARWRAWLEEPSAGKVLCVAESAQEEVFGFASGGPGRKPPRPGYDGELYAIYLLPERQREGAGKALFEAVAGRLAAQERRSMFLWTMERNVPARRFYEALGGELVGKSSFEVEEAVVGEVAYGWRDVGRFLHASETL